MLVRLMYVSRAAPSLDKGALKAILENSRRNNQEEGITGVLCYSEGIFLQALEGGRSAVNRLYNRIAADPRHTDVELLEYQEISERRFVGWSMGQVNLAKLNPSLLLKYSERAVLDPYSASGEISRALLMELLATASIICPA